MTGFIRICHIINEYDDDDDDGDVYTQHVGANSAGKIMVYSRSLKTAAQK